MTTKEKQLLISALESLHGNLASLGSLANNYSRIIHDELDATAAKIESLKTLLLP